MGRLTKLAVLLGCLILSPLAWAEPDDQPGLEILNTTPERTWRLDTYPMGRLRLELSAERSRGLEVLGLTPQMALSGYAQNPSLWAQRWAARAEWGAVTSLGISLISLGTTLFTPYLSPPEKIWASFGVVAAGALATVGAWRAYRWLDFPLRDGFTTVLWDRDGRPIQTRATTRLRDGIEKVLRDNVEIFNGARHFEIEVPGPNSSLQWRRVRLTGLRAVVGEEGQLTALLACFEGADGRSYEVVLRRDGTPTLRVVPVEVLMPRAARADEAPPSSDIPALCRDVVSAVRGANAGSTAVRVRR